MRPPSSLQPPAWYADRRHASALRYWDGRRWTSRWRPAPGWAAVAVAAPTRPAPGSPPPFPAPPRGLGGAAAAMRRARGLAFASAAALAAAAMLGTVVTVGQRGRVSRITDAAFVRSANGACAAALDPLRRQPRPGRLAAGERAARIDRLASTLGALAAQLRTIPVQEADRPTVQAWLAGWDDYTAIANELAVSVRAGDVKTSSLASQANSVDVRALVFARANGIDQCVF